MDKNKLEEQKNTLVWTLNEIQKKIDSYWLLDIACDSWPFKDLIRDRDRIVMKIEEIKKLLDTME